MIDVCDVSAHSDLYEYNDVIMLTQTIVNELTILGSGFHGNNYSVQRFQLYFQ